MVGFLPRLNTNPPIACTTFSPCEDECDPFPLFPPDELVVFRFGPSPPVELAVVLRSAEAGVSSTSGLVLFLPGKADAGASGAVPGPFALALRKD